MIIFVGKPLTVVVADQSAKCIGEPPLDGALSNINSNGLKPLLV